MNKLLRTVCAGVLLAGALTVSVFAADFTECADHLKALGLFQGTAQGYELNRAPTRAEAAAMLVRLLGKEDEARALPYDAPFTDLDDWQKPYVQYLYQNGLTTGVTESTFDPQSMCTARMYAAFLLRALGYTERAGDFTYREAADFALSIGLYDPATVDEARFLRDHVAAASYTALSIAPKDEQQTLLDQLTGQGAVDAAAAEPYRALFADYAAYRRATDKMDGVTALSLTHALTLDAGSFAMQSDESIALDLAARTSLSQRTVTLTAPGGLEKTFTAESYTAGGYRYLRQDGVRSRRALSEAQMSAAFTGYARVPVALIESVTAIPAGSYTIAYSKAGMARLDAVLEAAKAAVGEVEALRIEDLSVTQTTADGYVSAQQVQLVFSGEEVSGTVKSVMQLVEQGGQVTVAVPNDLDQYPLVG